MIVDDIKMNRRILREILTEDGQRGGDGKGAVEPLLGRGISCPAMLLDIMMPVMNGAEV